MRKILAVALLAITFGGCNAPTPSYPAYVAPTKQDWEAAFSRLSPENQNLIRRSPVSVEGGEFKGDDTIFSMSALGLSEQKITPERLKVATLCDGFGRSFGNGHGKKWTVVSARTYEQLGCPDGIQRHRVEMDWTFKDSAENTVSLSETSVGPGVSVWEPRDAIDAEMNQAFARAFLNLMADLAH